MHFYMIHFSQKEHSCRVTFLIIFFCIKKGHQHFYNDHKFNSMHASECSEGQERKKKNGLVLKIKHLTTTTIVCDMCCVKCTDVHNFLMWYDDHFIRITASCITIIITISGLTTTITLPYYNTDACTTMIQPKRKKTTSTSHFIFIPHFLLTLRLKMLH